MTDSMLDAAISERAGQKFRHHRFLVGHEHSLTARSQPHILA